MFAYNGVMTKALSAAVQEGSAAAYLSAGLSTASTIGGSITGVLSIMMLIAGVLDIWDPMGYGSTLNAETLQHVADSFNNQFSTAMLNNTDMGKTSQGKTIYRFTWPMMYDLGQHIMQTPLTTEEEKEYTLLIAEYYKTLKYNSLGELIVWDKTILPLPEPSDFQKYAKTFDLCVSNGNTYVSNWLARWWGLLLTLLIILFVVIIKFL